MSAEQSDSESSISLKGRLLIASPSLADGTFDRAVIYIAEHSATEGALGIILNHPTPGKVDTLFPDPAYQAVHHLPVHNGGPLSQEKLIFSALSSKTSGAITMKLQISPGQAASLITKTGLIIRATRGYSAWSPGQLESELVQNTWITARPTADLLTLPHDTGLWKTVLSRISPYHELLSNAPATPLLN